MKIYLITLVFTLLSIISNSQNLVRNPGFDSLNYCPNNYNQVDAALHWAQAQNNLNPSYGSDYLNSCTNGSFTVPDGTWGYQNTHSGNGYMATVTMAPSVATNYRENIYGQLSSPLMVGGTYDVSFYISHTDNSKYSSNNLGVKFSTVPSFPINNISHIHSDNIYTDNNNWIQISGTFTADSAYTYIALGNFYTDVNTLTTTSCSSCPFVLYGYFIDDVSVSRHSTAGINDYNSEILNLSVYPNPGKDIINLNYKESSPLTVEIRNTLGELILTQQTSDPDPIIHFEGYDNGMYLIIATDSKGNKRSISYIKQN